MRLINEDLLKWTPTQVKRPSHLYGFERLKSTRVCGPKNLLLTCVFHDSVNDQQNSNLGFIENLWWNSVHVLDQK